MVITMNIQKLTYFVSVADNLSFTIAANECHIAQTAMSRQIANMEKELGVKLFERDNRHVSLTNEGKEFYWYAMNMLETYREAVGRMDMIMHGDKYNLKIGIGPYESLLLAPLLKDFQVRFPQIDLSCLQFNYEQLSRQLMSGTIDLMLCIDHCADRAQNFHSFVINRGHWGVIGPAEHPLSKQKELSHHDLTGETIITMTEYNYDNYVRNLEAKGAFPKCFIRVNSYAAKLLFVQAGSGLAFAPGFVEQNLPKDIHFIRLKENIDSNFVCAYPRRKRNKTFLNFVEFLEAQTGRTFEQDPM